MNGLAMPKAPRVFLSYASEDRHWVKQFKGWFCDLLGNVFVVDFLDGNNLDFGPLEEWLNEQVDEAAVMVAFVSDSYIEKAWTIVEWQRGLTQAKREKSIFVPVMMHADAKAWWEQLRKDGKLDALPQDFQYADLTDEGRRALLADGSPAVEKVTNLARRIKKKLDEWAPPLPLPASGRGADEDRKKNLVADEPEVVILGHPILRLDDDLQAELKAAAQELSRIGLSSRGWPDTWWKNKDKPEYRAKFQTSMASPVVVQIVVPEEADPTDICRSTADRLGKLGIAGARVALWLPQGQTDSAFEAAVKSAKPDIFPAFRTDTPDGLAEWLRTLLGSSGANSGTMRLQIEAMRVADANPATKYLCNALGSGFRDIVRETVPGDSPSPQPFFLGDAFKVQMEDLMGGRAIVAVHDLNIQASPDRRAIRKQLEDKLKYVQDTIEEINKVNKDNSEAPPLDLFFVALLARHASAFPCDFPPDGNFKDWQLLHFEPTGKDVAPIAPNLDSLELLKGEMSRWASDSLVGGGR